MLKLQDPDRREENLATASTMPSLLLKGKQPRLIDEWQDAPMLWDAVRIAVDKSGGKPGQYILTGSNTVDMGKIYHSGIGRISRMKMFPMSLWESNDSSGEVSLKQLFDNPDYDIDGATSKLNIPELIRVAYVISARILVRLAKVLILRAYERIICLAILGFLCLLSIDEISTSQTLFT